MKNLGLGLSKKQNLRVLSHQFMYGAREVILDYASLPSNLFIGGVLQHGDGPPFSAYNNFPSPRKSFKRFPVFVANSQIKNHWSSLGMKNIEVSGSTWAYALKNFSSSQYKVDYQKKKYEVLFFPTHLAIGYREHSKTSIELRFQALRNQFDSESIQCCVYWSDLIDDTWFAMGKKYSIDIVCAGISTTEPVWAKNSLRTNFLLKLGQIIDQSEKCIFENYTSALIYALTLAKPVKLLNSTELELIGERLEFLSQERQWVLDNLPHIQREYICDGPAIKFANSVCGLENRVSPEEVAEFFRMFEYHLNSQKWFT